jgi:Fe-Mn family superoxide dismutase
MENTSTLGLERREFLKTAAAATLLAGAGVLGVQTAAHAEAFPMPALPYPENALEPVISARTVSFHYGKHTAAYYANANKAAAEMSARPARDGGDRAVELRQAGDGRVFNNTARP